MPQITSSCVRRSSEVEGGVVALGPGGLDIAQPVAVVVLARALEPRGHELPGVALVRPVVGLQAMRRPEVPARIVGVAEVMQVLAELELGGGFGLLRRA